MLHVHQEKKWLGNVQLGYKANDSASACIPNKYKHHIV